MTVICSLGSCGPLSGVHTLGHSLDVPFRGACVVLGLGLVCVMRGVGTCPSDVWCWDRTWCVSCVVLGHVPRMCDVGAWPGVCHEWCWDMSQECVVLGLGLVCGVLGVGNGSPDK